MYSFDFQVDKNLLMDKIKHDFLKSNLDTNG